MELEGEMRRKLRLFQLKLFLLRMAQTLGQLPNFCLKIKFFIEFSHLKSNWKFLDFSIFGFKNSRILLNLWTKNDSLPQCGC